MLSTKNCSKCKENKSLIEFNKESKATDGRHRWCRNCCALWRKANVTRLVESNRRCREKKPEQYKATARRNVLKGYGMTPDDFNYLLAQQNDKCAICKTSVAGGNNNTFHIDHSHSTLNIRGLLCHHCNKGIGQLKDSVEILQNAIDYLQTAKTNFYKKVRTS